MSDVLHNNNNNMKEMSVIVDSGTTYHICRSKDSFEHIGNKSVNIRGVGGSSKGFLGVLKPCELGVHIPAVWFEGLPVEMLISTEGLKQHGWETMFLLEGDEVRHSKTGTVLFCNKGESGLPTLNLNFGENDEAFICTPCADASSFDDSFVSSNINYIYFANVPIGETANIKFAV